MNALTKIRVASRFPHRIYRTFASHGKEEEESPWYRDNAPGPYPKTEEEKCAAAKKYGLLREEYEPYPDDGDGFGDYPKLNPINVEERDPFRPWTDKQYRRDHAEVIPADFLFFLPGRARYYKPKHSTLHYFLGFLSLPALIGVVLYFFGEYRLYHDTLEKQFHKPGVVHYTFNFHGEEGDEDSHHHH